MSSAPSSCCAGRSPDHIVLETVVGANLGCNAAGPYGGPGQCLNDEDPVDFQTFGPDQSYARDSAGAATSA